MLISNVPDEGHSKKRAMLSKLDIQYMPLWMLDLLPLEIPGRYNILICEISGLGKVTCVWKPQP